MTGSAVTTFTPKPVDPAVEGWKVSALAYKESNDRNEAAAFAFQERAVKAEASVAVLEASVVKAETHGHRVGYLEARAKYGAGGILAGMALTAVLALGVANFNQWREDRAVNATVRQANDAFAQGVVVGGVRSEQGGEDRGVSRGREPADAPKGARP